MQYGGNILDTVTLSDLYKLRKGDWLRLEMDSASRGCCIAAHRDKTALGIDLL